jgi:hypothetical protein
MNMLKFRGLPISQTPRGLNALNTREFRNSKGSGPVNLVRYLFVSSRIGIGCVGYFLAHIGTSFPDVA